MEREELFLPLQVPESGGTNIYRRLLDLLLRSTNGSEYPSASPVDRSHLNPCEKLRRYGRIPRKLTVHTLLVLATSYMVYLWTSNDALHLRHSYSHFHRVLLGVSGFTPGDRKIEIATAEDLKKQLDDTVEAFWALGESRLTDYTLCKDPLVFQVHRMNEEPDVVTIALRRDSWRTDPDYQRLTTEVNSNITRYSVRGTVHDVFRGAHWNQCLRWGLEPAFDYGGTGLVIGSLHSSVSECSKAGETNVWVPLVVIALATISSFLCTRTQIKGRFVSKWYLFNVLANVLQIIAALGCLRLVRRMNVSDRFSLIGLSALTAWLCVLRYLRYFHIYYVLVRTLGRAVPKCMRFVTGVSPILIGYALLGNCLFYHSPLFTTIGGSIATLFSLLNGDIIRDSFSDVGELVPFWGEVYLYTFLCLFIYVVLHIFISIVEEAYFSAKRYSDSLDDAASIADDEPQTMELVFEEQVPSTTNSSDQLSEYVIQNIKTELNLLKAQGRLDQIVKSQLVHILNS